MDFTAHNEQQAAVWKAYHAGKPTRVPMILGISSRYTIFHPLANPEGYDFEQFFCAPRAMFTHLLRKQHFIRHHLLFDQEMGLPEQWTVGVDLQNSYEALWWGCELHFRPGQVPDTTPLLTAANKRLLLERGAPAPSAAGWSEPGSISSSSRSGRGPRSSRGGPSSPQASPVSAATASSPPLAR